MTDTTTPTSQSHLSIQSLRLPQNFGQTLGVKKLLTNVTVGKPRPAMFFQVHPDHSMEFKALIYEDKSAGETYAVHPDLGDLLGNLARPVVLHLAVDRRGNPHLIPVVLPNEAGIRNPWHDSLEQAVVAAKKQWVRISANRTAGVYDIYAAKEKLAPPEWPEESMDQLVVTAFRGKVINSPDHPVIQALEGRQ
jgi:hypothetical protein